MSLSDEYRRQSAWRPYAHVMDLLPPLAGKTVLDLGCSVGDQAAELAQRGARVIGIDSDQQLLATAESRRIPNVEFQIGDLRALGDVGSVDGIWCSFATAYVPELAPTLAGWRQHINTGGWIALTEIDDLFGHEPVDALTRSLLDAYARDALAANRYDFHMGRKLQTHVEQAGFTVVDSRVLPDAELCFDGAAASDVLASWTARLDRMKVLRDFCGANFERVRDDFLSALRRVEHRSLASVHCCIAVL